MKLPRRLIGGPVRPDRWTAMRFASLRWAALPVIDRRWTVPLSAMALAFGIFVGVAIGPSTEGGIASQMQTMVQVVRPPAPVTDIDNGNGGGNGGPQGDQGPSQPTPSPPTDTDPFDPPTTPTPTPTTPTTPTTTTPTTTTPTTTTTTPTDDSDDDEDDDGDQPVPTLVKGAVVHVNEYADSYTVARNDGTLTAVHASNLPSLGDVISVETRTLANGTRAENGDRSRTDRTEDLDLSGTVTFSDPRIGAYTVSVPGSSIMVRVPAGTRMPQVADQVDVSARIANKLDPIEAQEPGRNGCGTPPRPPGPRKLALEQTGLEVTGTASASGMEGIVQGVCRKSGSLVLSADDLRATGRDIAVAVPPSFRLGDLEPGQILKLRVDIGDSGNFTASALADDEGEERADNSGRVQE
jgi:hypothetical protein